jgi:hypothetical protein
MFKLIFFLKYKLTARHRKGFSVHSPFVFDLLNNVFFEKNIYYSYEKIEKICNNASQIKQKKLLFRLANYFNCKKILLVGKNEYVKKCLNWVNSNAEFIEIIDKKNNIDVEKFDFIYISNAHFDIMDNIKLNTYKKNTIIVLENIYQNISNKNYWQKVKSNKEFNVVINIFSLGIVFVNSNLPKQNYTVAF